MKTTIALALTLMLTAGCASGLDIAGKMGNVIAGPATKVIFGLAVDDAKTTLAWVDAQVTAGAMAADQAALAKSCPQAVIDLAETRDKLLNPPTVPGFKGLIYNSTVAKYAVPGYKDQARAVAMKVLAACSDLAPMQLLTGF